MNPELPDEAVELGESAAKAFIALGGVDAARRAETDPDFRRGEVFHALSMLGLGDIDPGSSVDECAAAGELCRMAGRVALPYPLSAVLMSGPDGLPLALVSGERWSVNHGDLFDSWHALDWDGGAFVAHASSSAHRSKLAPFVTELSGSVAVDDNDPDRAAFCLTLTGWSILGSVERAVELAVDHVTTRVQFGKRLSKFQAVQFQLADAAVDVSGLRELCWYTTWRLFAEPSSRRVDAVALRLKALDTAASVLRTAQQLHGASGFCDEYDISVISRHIQPDLRLPFASEQTAAELFDSVAATGFEALFPQGGRQ